MEPYFDNLKSLVQQGTSIEFCPEFISYNNLRQIIIEASRHPGCIVTLHTTDAFSAENWKLLSAEGRGHLKLIFG